MRSIRLHGSYRVVRGELMASRSFRDPQSRVDQSLKDVHLMIEQARACGQELPFAQVYAGLLEQCIEQGQTGWDNAVIVEAIAVCRTDA